MHGSMISWRKVLVSAMAAIVVVEAVYADLMPVCGRESGCKGVVCHCGQREPPEMGLSCLFDGRFSSFGLGGAPEEVWPEPETSAAEASEGLHYLGLTEGSTSFDLCLYALVGLGLCRSGHWVRRSSFGFVPDWYHNGGPFQIGHSHAVSLDCRCSAQMCFIQADRTEQNHIPQYRLRTVVSLWRKSLFTPTAFASRGPPLC